MKFSTTIAFALAATAFAMPAPEEAAVTSKSVAKPTTKTHVVTSTKVLTTLQTKTTSKPTKTTGIVSCITKTYNPKITVAPLFTDLTCEISKALTPGQPLSCFFPTADKIGNILGPFLRKAIGTKTIEDLDVVAEDLCISAVQDKKDGNGLCDNTLQLVRDLAASQDQGAVHKYKCLLNLLCVAHATNKNKGTCQFLLAGVDCVANRILKVPGAPECGKAASF